VGGRSLNRYWHYTTLLAVKEIIASGEIKAIASVPQSGETPGAWFSTNSEWEETVRKVFLDTKTGRQTEPLSRDALWVHGYPPARIEVDPVLVTLHGWTEHKTMTEDSRKMLKSMERVGRKWGGHPNEWFVSYESVPLTKCLSPIEYWNGEKWVAIKVVIQ